MVNLAAKKLEFGELSFLDENCAIHPDGYMANIKRLIIGSMVLFSISLPFIFSEKANANNVTYNKQIPRTQSIQKCSVD